MIAMPVSSAYISELAGAGKRGRYLGLSGLTWSLCIVLGPNLGLHLFAWHVDAWWFGMAAIGLLAAIIV
jgi:MFS family permease